MNSATILVVEDDPVTARALEGQLRLLGHRLAGVASDAARALDILDRASVDLTLMDIGLPGEVDGVELASLIRKRHGGSVVFLTARSDPETFERAKVTDPMGYLTKPVSVEDLRRVVGMALYRRELQRQLERSEERYRLIFENAAAGIWTATPEGRLLSGNTALADMLGYDSAEELLNCVKDVAVQYYFETERFATLRALLQDGGEVRRFESRVFGRDGDVLWVEEHVRFVPEGEEQEPFILATVLDVTARREAEDALNLAHEMLQRTIDAIPDLVCLVDLEGAVILANSALAARRGVTKEELLGRPFSEVVYAADEPLPDDPIHKVLSQGQAVTNFMCTDHRGMGYFISASPFHGLDGRMVGVVHVTRDLSEVKLV